MNDTDVKGKRVPMGRSHKGGPGGFIPPDRPYVTDALLPVCQSWAVRGYGLAGGGGVTCTAKSAQQAKRLALVAHLT